MDAHIKVNDWGHLSTQEVEATVSAPGKRVANVSVSYDGGRLLVYVNGKEVYKNMGCSHDVAVSLEFPE